MCTYAINLIGVATSFTIEQENLQKNPKVL